MCHRQIKITTYDRLAQGVGKFYGGGKRFSKLCRFDGGQRQSETGFYDFAENSTKQATKLRNLLLEYKKSNA